MVTRIRAFRPRPRPRFVAVPSPSSSPSSSSALSSSGSSRPSSVSSWDVWPVGVEWDEFRSLHIARCQRCADSFASSSSTEADDWADTHHCDPEMAALLALVDTRRAA
ncbi:hypothetical protein [Actinomadura madurae]|uniref:hypothetical protein n=1 Tax=Actinomadura madurae TaxID=1993 RepID=UPI0020D20532|nr:hypothetical protein [Actinomadura madurae]MCP9952915.1 hypothetical protein [Actinomadura madurae]MCP9969678.1 hypothetical protein [Actinomadura madurae]MCP9982133.1 hypothetical protein [Actinomadura madurae]MCQ0006339.1 hypothetical protein [Actinomadura madurae]MCQ0018379.1 hypothetical protein [Actinomadura madurae]